MYAELPSYYQKKQNFEENFQSVDSFSLSSQILPNMVSWDWKPLLVGTLDLKLITSIHFLRYRIAHVHVHMHLVNLGVPLAAPFEQQVYCAISKWMWSSPEISKWGWIQTSGWAHQWNSKQETFGKDFVFSIICTTFSVII